MKTFYISLYKGLRVSVEALLCFTIKLDVLLIYAFSRTFLVAFYLFAIVGGFCAGEKADISTLFLFLFSSYVSGSSVILVLVCGSKTTRIWVEKLVGTPFLEKFAPNRGKTNCYILVYSLLGLLFVDYISMVYFIQQTFQECDLLSDSIRVIMEKGEGNQNTISQLYQKKAKLLVSISETKGICCQMHGYFPFLQIHRFFGN